VRLVAQVISPSRARSTGRLVSCLRMPSLPRISSRVLPATSSSSNLSVGLGLAMVFLL
jgi:hypothetical protein